MILGLAIIQQGPPLHGLGDTGVAGRPCCKGCIVTIDAAGCQPAIAAKIVGKRSQVRWGINQYKALAIAIELLAAGIGLPQVAVFTHLPLAEIEALNQGLRDA